MNSLTTVQRNDGDLDARVESVRAFNRAWTARSGVLGASHLGTPYSLTEARILYELARRAPVEVLELRRELGLDAGYLSRVMSGLREKGVLKTEASGSDARRQVARLTGKGRRAFKVLDTRAAEQVRALLSPLREEEQRRLAGALGAVRDLLMTGPASAPAGPLGHAPARADACLIRPPRHGDLGWVLHRHGLLYAEEYGWNEGFEALVATVIARYANERDPKRDAAWIAEVAGAPAGCVFCIKKDDDVAQLRLLLVEPRFRGLGLGARLVDECIGFARRAGYRSVTLWTNDVLTAARRIYEQTGFVLVEQQPHRRFGPDLMGQTWSLAL